MWGHRVWPHLDKVLQDLRDVQQIFRKFHQMLQNVILTDLWFSSRLGLAGWSNDDAMTVRYICVFPLYFPDTGQCVQILKLAGETAYRWQGADQSSLNCLKRTGNCVTPGPQVAGIKYVLHYMQSSQWSGVGDGDLILGKCSPLTLFSIINHDCQISRLWI